MFFITASRTLTREEKSPKHIWRARGRSEKWFKNAEGKVRCPSKTSYSTHRGCPPRSKPTTARRNQLTVIHMSNDRHVPDVGLHNAMEPMSAFTGQLPRYRAKRYPNNSSQGKRRQALTEGSTVNNARAHQSIAPACPSKHEFLQL